MCIRYTSTEANDLHSVMKNIKIKYQAILPGTWGFKMVQGNGHIKGKLAYGTKQEQKSMKGYIISMYGIQCNPCIPHHARSHINKQWL